MIYFTSDWHLNDWRETIWKNRGFESLEDMQETILGNLNETISKSKSENATTTLYILGDLFNVTCNIHTDNNRLIRNELQTILKGVDTYIILGNHDFYDTAEYPKYTYRKIGKVLGTSNYTIINGTKYYLCHFPTTIETMPEVTDQVFNLYGHTHQKDPFIFNQNYYQYNVGVDAHNFYPVSLDEVEKYVKYITDWRGKPFEK